MKLLIIIPTLNEKKNINYMVKKIFFRIKKASILFVDDNSIDGTRDIILSLKKKIKEFSMFLEKIGMV